MKEGSMKIRFQKMISPSLLPGYIWLLYPAEDLQIKISYSSSEPRFLSGSVLDSTLANPNPFYSVEATGSMLRHTWCWKTKSLFPSFLHPTVLKTLIPSDEKEPKSQLSHILLRVRALSVNVLWYFVSDVSFLVLQIKQIYYDGLGQEGFPVGI